VIPHFSVTDACGAPGGIAAWIQQIIEDGSSTTLGLGPRFHPLRKLEEMEAAFSRAGPAYPACGKSPFEADWPWVYRLALLRHRYLDSFPKEKHRAPPPNGPDLANLWHEIKRKEVALDRISRNYASLAEMKLKGRSDIPEKAKPGRRGDAVLRATIDALIGLFELCGTDATQTQGGPAVRFANTFFSGLDAEWVWILAIDWVVFAGEQPPDATLRHVENVKRATPEALRNEVRRALQRQKTKSRERRAIDVGQIFTKAFYPVSGAFAVLDDRGARNGRSRWANASNSRSPDRISDPLDCWAPTNPTRCQNGFVADDHRGGESSPP
jgi:hypothetical protein